MSICIKLQRRDILLLILVLLAGFLVFTKFAVEQSVADQKNADKEIKKLMAAYEIIKTNYVKELSTDDIFKNALKGMVSRLDPYSDYFTAEEFKEFEASLKGEFAGVGMEITMEDSILTVITPLEDSPAFRAGILAGDRILEIDEESIEGLSILECTNRIRGKANTKVALTVLHKGEASPENITITRQIIKISSIKQARIIDNTHKIGYLRITNFQEDTTKSFEEAVEQLKKNGMKALIIDLRFNGGGLMEPAIELANKFINSGVIVSTRGRSEETIKTYEADSKRAVLSDLPLVVLVNGGSASASEIFAGAIQDHKRGTLVGSKTYGKGSVQTVLSIPEDNSAVKLTIARYYTPKGICLQREKDKNYGLEPDILIELTPQQEAELLKSRVQEEVISPPDKQPPDKTSKFEDSQLQKAIEVLNKK